MTTDSEIRHTDIDPEKEVLHRAKTLRIAIISDAAPGRNGVGTFYVDLSTHLEKYVRHIETLSPVVEDDKWKAGLVFPLPGDKTQKLCMPNPFAMKRRLSEIKPDVILIATPGVYGLVGAMLAGRLGIPAIAGFHTSFEKITELYWNNSVAGSIVHAYFKVSNRYLFKKCPLILANSEEMIDQAKRIGAQNTRIVSTPISSVFTDPPQQPYSGHIKRVLFAGRLAPEKNIDALLDAAETLPDIHFTIAGEGPLRDQVEEKMLRLSNLHCVGWLDRDSLRKQIDAHDALVLPSHFESFGTIALEAMARQRLVIVSRHCGIVEWEAYKDGLNVIDDTLCQTLKTLSELDESTRSHIASQAYAITQEINQQSIQEWCALLLNSAAKRN